VPIPDNETYTASFGYWIKRRRLALDLTQAAFARRVGCATTTIKKIERDERRPSHQMALRLAAAFQLTEAEQEQFMVMATGRRPADAMPLAREPLDAEAEAAPPWLTEGRQAAAGARKARFVGREAELVRLQNHLQAALAGRGRTVFVTGEAGRGKTALLAEFARVAQAAVPDLVVSQGVCSAVAGFGDPYLPFREMLSALTGDVEGRWQAGTLTTEQAARLWALAPAAAATVIASGPQLVDVLVPASSLRPRLKAPAAARLQALARRMDLRRDRLFEQLTAVLFALAEQKPLLLLIDDLQWADTASTSLLFHLGRRLQSSRILLLCAYRSSEVLVKAHEAPGGSAERTLRETLLELERLSRETEINLDACDPQEDRRLSDLLLDREANRLPDTFRRRFFEHTRGHPLFAVELLREMQAQGHVAQDQDGCWVAKDDIDWDALPPRAVAVIEQRLARLDEGSRRVLDVASVEGECFTPRIVAAVSGLDEQRLLRLLARDLEQRHNLVRERGELAGCEQHLARYQFHHVLFRRYLYQSLGDGERQRRHARVAASMEALHQADLDPVSAEIARHYVAAGDGTQAVHFLLRAGDRARSLYAHHEATEHYRHALDLQRAAGDREGAARTLMKLGLAHHTAFDYDRAREAYQEGFGLWQQTGGLARPRDDRRTLRLNWISPASLDPVFARDLLANGLVSHLFSGLVALTPGLDVVPDVAHRWEVAGGGRIYTFFLRPDARWSDGRPLTAGDFEYSWKRALEPETCSPLAGLLLHEVRGAAAYHLGEARDAGEVGVTVVDDHTLVVELVRPTGYFPQLVAYPALFPVPRHVVERDPGGWAKGPDLVSNGPFTLARRDAGRIRLARNPAWHGRSEGNVAQIELILDAEMDALWRMYGAGELDVLNLWMLPTQVVDAARRHYAGEYISGPQLLTHYLRFDTRFPPFDDVRVRRALALASDRRRLAHVTLGGVLAPAAGGFVPPGIAGHVPGAALTLDVEQARALLAEAGSPGGAGFPALECAVPRGRAHLVEPLFDQWHRHLGIDVRPCELPERELADAGAGGRFALALAYWAPAYPDPDSFLRLGMDVETGNTGWHPAAYVRLMDRARRLTNQQERMALYRQAEEMLAAEVPILPLLYGRKHLLVKPWVAHFQTSPLKQRFWHETVIDEGGD
jgi:ABC-type oligopeptide transport system substrate-binding subunit/transcriptional regulator with XRE-family HTH domain